VRAFVAVEVTGTEERARASAPEHLTLQFLGEVPVDAVPRFVERLRPVGRATPPFAFRLEGVGAFPTASDPRVVWVGVTAGRAELTELAVRVRRALESEGRAAREAFVPHLTLFRVRSASDRYRAAEVLEGRRPPPPPRTVPVREFVLKESVLGPRGVTHRTIEAFPLSGPVEEA